MCLRHRETPSRIVIEQRHRATPTKYAIEQRHRATPSGHAIEQGNYATPSSGAIKDIIERRRQATPSIRHQLRGWIITSSRDQGFGIYVGHRGQDRVDDTKIIEGPRRSKNAVRRSPTNYPRGRSPKKMPTKDRGDQCGLATAKAARTETVRRLASVNSESSRAQASRDQEVHRGRSSRR